MWWACVGVAFLDLGIFLYDLGRPRGCWAITWWSVICFPGELVAVGIACFGHVWWKWKWACLVEMGMFWACFGQSWWKHALGLTWWTLHVVGILGGQWPFLTGGLGWWLR